MSTSSTARQRPASLTASKRASLAPAPPKPPLTIHPTAVIAQHALITGTFPVTIGADVVLHPHARIYSFGGPVTLGEGVWVGEKAVVGINQDLARREEEPKAVNIGKDVTVETGATVLGGTVGEGTVIEGAAKIWKGCQVGMHCTIASQIDIQPNTILADYTVVYGPGLRRLDTTLATRLEIREAKALAHSRQIELCKRLIPNQIAKWQ